jgi:hypothetical protein
MIQVTSAVTRKAMVSVTETGNGPGLCSIACGGMRCVALRKKPVLVKKT